MSAPDPKSPTWKVVGGVLAAGVLVFMAFILTWPWFLALAVLLAYEIWTFGNRYANDTISEVVWELVKRPLVPFMLGAGAVALLAHGIVKPNIEGLYVSLAVGMIMGHFVWQRAGDE